jgi:hypothetical protein
MKALGATDDDCPQNAIPCPDGNSPAGADLEGRPMFSNLVDEVPPWVEGGRYPLYLKEHN